MPKENEGKDEKKVDPYQKYKDFKWEDPDSFKNGPVGDANRKCRDIICTVIFIVFLGGCVVVAYLAFTEGNPDLILYPYDEDSGQCGRGDRLRYPYLYFYSSTENILTFNSSKIVNTFCVQKCPDESIPENTAATLICYPTTKHPNCQVDYKNYYKSMPSKSKSY